MNDHDSVLRSRQQHCHDSRTPAVGGSDHPPILWQSNESRGSPIDLLSLPQGHTAREQLDRCCKTDSQSAPRADPQNGESAARKDDLPWRERVKHITWAYFTICMATGGLANALHAGT